MLRIVVILLILRVDTIYTKNIKRKLFLKTSRYTSLSVFVRLINQITLCFQHKTSQLYAQAIVHAFIGMSMG